LAGKGRTKGERSARFEEEEGRRTRKRERRRYEGGSLPCDLSTGTLLAQFGYFFGSRHARWVLFFVDGYFVSRGRTEGEGKGRDG